MSVGTPSKLPGATVRKHFVAAYLAWAPAKVVFQKEIDGQLAPDVKESKDSVYCTSIWSLLASYVGASSSKALTAAAQLCRMAWGALMTPDVVLRARLT